MDFCKTCVYYPPSSCDGKPCTQCDPESPFQNCYVKKEADSKPTNADRIRSMTDEELANCITDDLCDRVCHSPLSCDGNCEIQVLEWLRQEAT